MKRSLVDVRDPLALSAALSQVFLFVEQLNAHAFLQTRRVFSASTSDFDQIYRRNISDDVVTALSRPGASWGTRSTLLSLARSAKVQPQVNLGLIGAVAELLEKLDLSGIAKPEKLVVNRAWLYEGVKGLSFASRPVGGSETSVKSLSLLFWEEPWDSLGVVHLFLSDVLGEEGRAVDHYLQHWLQTVFDLTYDKATKYCLAVICERFNLLFYGSPVPSSQEIHTQRPATLGTSLLVSEILYLLRARRDARSDASEDLLLRQALGIYLFIRFCRQLRCRFFWPVDAENDALPRLEDHQCVTALRSLGYTYFQARMFGRISAIPGLSNIFRGGLLPRTDSGTSLTLIGPPGGGKTVLALQMMADIARSGGIAIYLSFEESYDSIVDRLVTFGLYDREKFQVEQAGQRIEEVVQSIWEEDQHKGILIFYKHDVGESFDLGEVIDSIARATRQFERSKALAIDSISALELRSGGDPGESFNHRINLRALIDSIEQSGFLGLILSERDDPNSTTLSYLADTVMQVGLDEALHNRWVEITKCRIQDYQSGRHPFRMIDGKGVMIYPSLVSRRSSLRRRVRSTLSEHRRIFLGEPWSKSLNTGYIREKSSTLIWGPPGSGKTLLLLRLLTEPCRMPRGDYRNQVEPERPGIVMGPPPRNVLLVTFRTSEVNFLQALRREKSLHQRWDRIQKTHLRWYSPGENITGDQIVGEVWRYISRSRRAGTPVERVAFDETEVAEDFLPSLRREPLFWPTLLEMTSTEAATSFFICGSEDEHSKLVKVLRAGVDYVFHTRQKSAVDSRLISIEKSPSLQGSGVGMELSASPALPVSDQESPPEE